MRHSVLGIGLQWIQSNKEPKYLIVLDLSQFQYIFRINVELSSLYVLNLANFY